MITHYNIGFIGLGSIAKRHIRNVVRFLKAKEITYSIDLYRSSIKNNIPDDIKGYISSQYLYADKLPKSRMYDVVFVTNPTSLHYEAVDKFKHNTKSFFIEKPVFSTTEVQEEFIETLEGIDCYVACPLRYNPVLQYVKNHIPYQNAISIRAISSSYLPDWRPGQDYRKCYSAHKDLGGGVDIDLIHEWDYLTSFYGIPQEVYSICDKISSLEIDSNDIAIYIAKVGTKTIELHLDYFGRRSQRILELYMPDDTIRCDILNGTVDWLVSGKHIDLDKNRDTFQIAEIKHFFEIINHKIKNDSTVRHALQVLNLTKGKLS